MRNESIIAIDNAAAIGQGNHLNQGATLMERQKIFETVAKHLFTQGEPAFDQEEELCLYRYKKRNKGKVKILTCAVGCLIQRKNYSPEMEGKTIENLVSYDQRGNYTLPNYFSKETGLLYDLQEVHDCNWNWSTSNTMRESLVAVAAKWELNSDFLPNLKFSDR